jgi:NAD(P)H dehydrogenase (quinone)
MLNILVLYYSRDGSVAAMAKQLARGIDEVEGTQAVLRTVPPISSDLHVADDEVPDYGPPYATLDDVKECAGLALGSPARFGNMAAGLKFFLEQTTSVWISGQLSGKPATVFTSSATIHGGQETTLTSMMTPLLHHGMLIVGVPYTVAELNTTTTGGTPYGSSHYAGQNGSSVLSEEEISLCHAQGSRLAHTALALHANKELFNQLKSP